MQAEPDAVDRYTDEQALPLDQALCAHRLATAFLGNFPSTVTTTILQHRDAAG